MATTEPVSGTTTPPVKQPFPHPVPSSKPAPPSPLAADHKAKYDELLAIVRAWETLPCSKGGEPTPLTDSERLWLTRECILRYLRATKWHVAQAAKRIEHTLVWRRDYGTEGFTAEYISEENATGKQVVIGFDNEGRPCLYLLPNKQNTKNSPKQVQHLVYMLERTLDIAPPGQETLALLIDFRNSSSGSNPSVATSREVLSILQGHYPERLGRALVTHLPWYVTVFLKLVSPFIDPVTKTKIRYNEPLTDHVPGEQLMKNAGGEVEFEYDHEIYWDALAEMAKKRREERMERWVRAGKLVGESEVYLWGGEEESIGAKEGKSAEPVADATAGVVAETSVPQNGSAEVKKDEDVVQELAKLEVKDEVKKEEPKKEVEAAK
ncbi:CRAL/TRIO domain-containing protein [Amniculicola lignicola CBS 123094]|uniref:CRAL/TRIO domain-containing protein n=1 Tax=Amniculicola lignicola CBS 123094 TaxID=1392246 RepID=A0A6A5W9N6_9PLEO|nr:CRAL/TRIO domain-containing protein [Amniculicola lignicola CBS 123094]